MTVRAMKDGAIDFLTKPVNAAALVDSIERAVQQYQVQIRKRRSEYERFTARYETLTPRERRGARAAHSGFTQQASSV